MQSKTPKFFSIDATGSELNDAHIAMLAQKFHIEGYDTEIIVFPRKDNTAGSYVEKYENNTYGSPDTVGPYAASLFYILDRYDAKKRINDALMANRIVVAIAYSASSIAILGSQFASQEERKGYFLWHDELEHRTFDNLRPEIGFVLRNQNIQSSLLSSFDSLCELFPKDYKTIDIYRNGQVLDIETINSILWENISTYLPHSQNITERKDVNTPNIIVGSLSSNSYVIPAGLSSDARKIYFDAIENLINKTTSINKSLESDDSKIFLQTSPLGEVIKKDIDSRFSKIITNYAHNNVTLPNEIINTYSSSFNLVTLVHRNPTNETELLESIIFKESELSLTEINEKINKLSYEEKYRIISESITSSTKPTVLQSYKYVWEFLTDIATLKILLDAIPALKVDIQPISPRYGFSTPSSIDAANLTDFYAESFDSSFMAYSMLEEKGFKSEAILVLLLGHKLRWRLSCNAEEVIRVMDILKNDMTGENNIILQKMLENMEIVHPVMYRIIFEQ